MNLPDFKATTNTRPPRQSNKAIKTKEMLDPKYLKSVVSTTSVTLFKGRSETNYATTADYPLKYARPQ